MLHFNPVAYGPVIVPLIESAPLCELGPGRQHEPLRGRLAALTVQNLFPGRRVTDADMARCCLAGLWLLHNFLDESHALSQEVETATGSYWHGIMHRREPDFGNAKYWFRRVGPHPVFEPLFSAAREIVSPRTRQGTLPAAARFLAEQPAWDPLRFVDLCEAAQSEESLAELCREVAQAEWRLLFDYSCRNSIEAET